MMLWRRRFGTREVITAQFRQPVTPAQPASRPPAQTGSQRKRSTIDIEGLWP
jgi:hypothetical protein